ncbi:MAG: amidohydrolase family protein [Eubacteriaceae bacterium]|nr:amidohydrolase family protein [Eubacteriaceae bacterium]
MENNNYADILLTGGSFFCGKDLDNAVDFIAVKDNKILAIGTAKDAEHYIGKDTVVKKYTKDQLIMPGFFDSHTHIISAGMADKYPNFGGCKTEDETARAAKAYADTVPDEEWIFGFNWYHVYWGQEELPTCKTLDKYIPDRPVMLTDAEGHGIWVNTKAMELCGITRDTPDPPFGGIEHFPDGEPSGFLHEMAIGLIARVAYNLDDEIEKGFIRDYMKRAKTIGITGANDMLPYYGNDMGKYRCFSELDKNGEFTLRLHCAPNLFGDLDEVKEAAKIYDTDKFQIRLLKAFIDGVPTTYTSLMLEPFIDNPSTKGGTLCDLDLLKEKIEEAHSKGLSVRLHCCGDGATHYALDCYEGAIEKFGDTGSRHAVEHVETTIQADIDRFARLPVIASMQPEHLAMTDVFAENPYLVRYNERQKKFCWPIKSIMYAGAVVSFGSDCPVVTNNPFVGIYRAVTRVHNDGEPKGGWNPEQKVTMAEALHAYTYNGYYGVKREKELGTLEPGKLADLIVIDQNLLTIPHEEIRGSNVIFTMIDGKVVYEK